MKNNNLKNEKGIASIEAALLLSIFVVFMTYCVGTFGVVHTGILNSIAARAYAFETFRNRTDVTYFRDTRNAEMNTTIRHGVRAHGISSEKGIGVPGTRWSVTDRTMSHGREVASTTRTALSDDNANNLNFRKRETGSANPVYLKTLYGICLNFNCGDSKQ